MQIKPLRSMMGDYGSLKRGRIAEVPDHIAQQLVKRGIAVPVQAGKGAAANAPVRPTRQAPYRRGGQTGEMKPSRSSPADQASAKSILDSSRGDAAS